MRTHHKDRAGNPGVLGGEGEVRQNSAPAGAGASSKVPSDGYINAAAATAATVAAATGATTAVANTADSTAAATLTPPMPPPPLPTLP